MIADLLALGMTDYVVMLHRFAPDRIVGAMDGVYLSWATEALDGFGERHLAALRRLAAPLALAVKAAALARIAGTLVETYLGRDAGRRVLEGGINRGVAERIEAVLWFSDLHGYTRISDTADPEQIIPLLNDYAGAIVPAIHAAGGDVLKLIGDGIFAIFTGADRGEACRSALGAVAAARAAVDALNGVRRAAGLPVTDLYLALHLGEVFYGNIGSEDRLDFTVVGPAVNEAARIAALCRSVDQPVLMSSAFAAAVDDPRLVSVGRFALRGVGRAQDLFTFDPGAG
ncbi:MAG: adenylate/guanylate cyclase domain-containing protein [Rhodospirillales bacterium]